MMKKLVTMTILVVAAVVNHSPLAKGVKTTQCTGYQKPGANVCLLGPQLVHLKNASDKKVVRLQLAAGDTAQPLQLRLLNTPFAKWHRHDQKVVVTEQRDRVEQTIEVRAPKAGYGYIHVLVQAGAGEQARTRVISIPVQVGKTDARQILKTEGTIKTAPNGEKVISFNGSD